MSPGRPTAMNRLSYFMPAFLMALAACSETPQAEAGAAASDGPTYDEPHRPQFHFSPARAWMNDPNGLFYLDGVYHMSYQYYPDSTVWGPMHWGHATSTDLVRWQEQPIALYPDSLGYIFSGSAVVDAQNTSGFGSLENPPVVAVFTHHDPLALEAGRSDFQSQSLAYSPDRGNTWQKYAGNPVLQNDTGIRDFRDPKVVWHPDSNQWVMALAVYDRVRFYGSANLKDWAYLSEFGIPGDTRLWECPDLFPLRMPGSRELKWVLLVSIQKDAPAGGTGTSYFVGDFDGTTFSADPASQQWLDYGADNYAFVTWSNAPAGWGQRLGIGWMSNWQYAQQVPTDPWRSAMTLPRVLQLGEDRGTYFLRSLPVPAASSLWTSETVLPAEIDRGFEVAGDFVPSRCELALDIDLEQTTAGVFGCTLSNEAGEHLMIVFHRNKNEVQIDRWNSGPKGFSEAFFKGPHKAPLNMEGASLDVRIFFDRASAELFADGGRLNATEVFFPSSPYTDLRLWTRGGKLVLRDGRVYGLESIWGESPEPR